MEADLKYPHLSVDSKGVLGGATAFTKPEFASRGRAEAGAVNGHLAVDQEGHVIFVADQPDHDPEKE